MFKTLFFSLAVILTLSISLSTYPLFLISNLSFVHTMFSSSLYLPFSHYCLLLSPFPFFCLFFDLFSQFKIWFVQTFGMIEKDHYFLVKHVRSCFNKFGLVSSMRWLQSQSIDKHLWTTRMSRAAAERRPDKSKVGFHILACRRSLSLALSPPLSLSSILFLFSLLCFSKATVFVCSEVLWKKVIMPEQKPFGNQTK